MDRRQLREIGIAILLLGVYFAAGKLGLRLAFVNASASGVWPPTGIAIALLLLLDYSYWPVIMAGAFLVNFTTAGEVGTSLAIAAGNTMEAVLAAYLVNRFAEGRHAMEQVTTLSRFVLLAGLVSTAVSATVGLTTLCIGHLALWRDYGPIWRTWWLGDATGALILTPFLLLWLTKKRGLRNPLQALEACLFLASLLGVGLIVFGSHSVWAQRHDPLEFLFLPLLLWAAFRFGPRGASATVVLLSGIAVWQTLHGLGPFVRPNHNDALLLLQSFSAIVAVTSLSVAAVVLERSEKETRLREAYATSESEVRQRTNALLRSNVALERELDRRMQAEQHERASHQRYRLLFERNLAGICLSTPEGEILECNEAFARVLGYDSPEELLPLRMDTLYFSPEERPELIARLIRQGRLNNVEMCFRRKEGGPVWILANFTYVERSAGRSGIIEASMIDITRIKNAQEDLRRLSAALMRSQDEERRKVARELHDSLGQYLAGVIMGLSQLRQPLQDAPELVATVDESIALCEKCLADMRTLSHLLHPPLLDEMGLESAVRWYTDGFAKRSGIKIALDIPPRLGRMPYAVETALFRILQESLTNIHRHSGSPSASISLESKNRAVVLLVCDEGCGMPDVVIAAYEHGREELGVGIVGMRERVKELGGRLEIRSNGMGTAIQATLPLAVDSEVDQLSLTGEE